MSSVEPDAPARVPSAAGIETSTAGGSPAQAGLEAAAAIADLAGPRRVESPAEKSLWRNRDFKIVLGGQSVSAFGDAVSFTALPLLVIALTGSGVAMGTVGVLQTLPDLLFGLPAGALADRWDRRRMMLWADVGRALLTALIPLAYQLDLPVMPVILLVTFPINTFRVLFMAGWTAAMPNLVRRDQVGQANGYAEAILSSSFIVGPAVAGFLVGTIGAGPTLAIDALSFAVSAGSLALVRRPFQKARGARESHLVAEIAEGLRFVAGEPTLRVAIAFWGLTSVVTAPIVLAVIYTLTIDRHLPSEVVGFVLSAYGIGYLVGAVVAGRLSRGPLGRLMLGANAVSAFVIALLAVAELPVVLYGGAFAAGFCGALVLISYITLRATIPPDELLGRVGSMARMVSVGLQPIGVFAGGVLLDLVHGGITMGIIGALTLLVTAVFSLSATLRRAVVPVRPVAG